MKMKGSQQSRDRKGADGKLVKTGICHSCGSRNPENGCAQSSIENRVSSSQQSRDRKGAVGQRMVIWDIRISGWIYSGGWQPQAQLGDGSFFERSKQ